MTHNGRCSIRTRMLRRACRRKRRAATATATAQNRQHQGEIGTAGQALPKWNQSEWQNGIIQGSANTSIRDPSIPISEFPPSFPPSTRWRRDGGHKHGGQRHTWPSPSLGCTRLPHTTKDLVQHERRRGTSKPQRHPKGAQEARSVGRVGSGGGGRSCLPSKETKDHHQQRLQSRSKLAPAAAPAGPRWSWRRPR